MAHANILKTCELFANKQFVIVEFLVAIVFLEVHSLLSQKQSVETTLGFFYDNYGNSHYVLRPDTTNG